LEHLSPQQNTFASLFRGNEVYRVFARKGAADITLPSVSFGEQALSVELALGRVNQDSVPEYMTVRVANTMVKTAFEFVEHSDLVNAHQLGAIQMICQRMKQDELFVVGSHQAGDKLEMDLASTLLPRIATAAHKPLEHIMVTGYMHLDDDARLAAIIDHGYELATADGGFHIHRRIFTPGE